LSDRMRVFRTLSRMTFVGCVASSGGTLSCATIGMAPAPTTERIVDNEHKEVQSDTNHVASLEDGTVVVRSKCDVFSIDRVEVTEHQKAKNLSPGVDWALGIAGTTAIALGAWALADAEKVYPDDKASRTYNPVGPGFARATGLTLGAIGVAALAVAAIDVARAQASDGTSTFVARQGTLPVGTCQGSVSRAVRVEAEFRRGGAGERVLLGETASDGTFRPDLRSVDPPVTEGELSVGYFGSSVEVFVENRSIGYLPIRDAYSAWIPRRQIQVESIRRETEARRSRLQAEALNRQKAEQELAEAERRTKQAEADANARFIASVSNWPTRGRDELMDDCRVAVRVGGSLGTKFLIAYKYCAIFGPLTSKTKMDEAKQKRDGLSGLAALFADGRILMMAASQPDDEESARWTILIKNDRDAGTQYHVPPDLLIEIRRARTLEPRAVRAEAEACIENCLVTTTRAITRDQCEAKCK
jgi:hypothetical protein